MAVRRSSGTDVPITHVPQTHLPCRLGVPLLPQAAWAPGAASPVGTSVSAPRPQVQGHIKGKLPSLPKSALFSPLSGLEIQDSVLGFRPGGRRTSPSGEGAVASRAVLSAGLQGNSFVRTKIKPEEGLQHTDETVGAAMPQRPTATPCTEQVPMVTQVQGPAKTYALVRGPGR